MPTQKPIPAYPNMGKNKNANIIFGVTHFKKRLVRGRYAERIMPVAGVYIAAVLEYLIAEVLELAGNATKENKKTRITPRYLQLAVRNDDEILHLIGNATLPQGGVLPHIPMFLLAKDRKERAALARHGASYNAMESSILSRPSTGGKTPLKAPLGSKKSTKSKKSRPAKDENQESMPA